jgi:hypothetical protein
MRYTSRPTPYRLTILALVLLLVALEASSDAAPVIKFSVYAPLQKDSPVHILGFEHDGHDIQFVLSNASNKSVVGVIVRGEGSAPPGCAIESVKASSSSDNGSRINVRIGPHGRAVASRDGDHFHYPKLLVHMAKNLGAAYLQAQFEVVFVYLEDGTTWPAKVPGVGGEPFDPSLVEAEAGKCADVAAIANALESVQKVVFDHEGPTVPTTAKDESAPPHFSFSCSLEGPKAICRLPRETDSTSQQAQPHGAAQRGRD